MRRSDRQRRSSPQAESLHAAKYPAALDMRRRSQLRRTRERSSGGDGGNRRDAGKQQRRKGDKPAAAATAFSAPPITPAKNNTTMVWRSKYQMYHTARMPEDLPTAGVCYTAKVFDGGPSEGEGTA